MNSGLVKFNRLLNIVLPKKQSAFLWGARKTGKSFYLREYFPKAIYYDLLKSDLYLELSKNPSRLRQEILALPATSDQLIIIDEVQKIPPLLNEVHWLIENTSHQFILCGSSVRKLKRGAANLLGGRAWRYTFYPLVYSEIPHFDLLRALNAGLIPSHYLSENPHRSLKAYVEDYLKEEIQAEGLVRSLPHFARFLDALPFSHGELINFSNIARECGIDAKTVKEYYQILMDTLLGYFIYPYKKHKKREIITATPKFYLFDVGVMQFLAKQPIVELKGSVAGKAFEHFILTELIAYRGLNDLDFDITYWRTKTGLEVDFVLGNAEVAIEVKLDNNVDPRDLKGLQAFCEEHPVKKAYVVNQISRARQFTFHDKTVTIIPWQDFLKELWNKAIIL